MELSKYERWTPRVMRRSELAPLPANPRKISAAARKKLKANLANPKFGLLQPPIWNERTRHVIGGHQRLDALDALHGGQDYKLTVAVVDIPAKDEYAQAIFMNNPSAQGQSDDDLLTMLLKGEKIEFDDGATVEVKVDALEAGFDLTELAVLLDDPDLEQGFGAPDADTQSTLDDLEAATDAGDGARKSGKTGRAREGDALAQAAAAAADAERERNKQPGSGHPKLDPLELKKRRDEYRGTDAVMADDENYAVVQVVVPFATREEREVFMDLCGVDPGHRYVDGERVLAELEADGLDTSFSMALTEAVGQLLTKRLPPPDDSPPTPEA